MPVQNEFIELAAPFRAELAVHCSRTFGSAHEAEDLVQETFLRGWRGYHDFEGRASLRTWLHRIATNECQRAHRSGAHRVVPAGLIADVDNQVWALGDGGAYHWLEPISDRMTPEATVTARQSLRLAMIAAMQTLPARQRAVLILRDVLRFRAAEVAELLETTSVAVNSALQRARARLAEVATTEDDVTEPDDAGSRALLNRYCAAFEHADVQALTELLLADIGREMQASPA